MKQQIVQLIDDIDGVEADETLEFVFDGISYEIDLSSKNAETFRELIAPWVGSARRMGRAPRSSGLRSVKPSAQPKRFTPADREALAKFAKKNKMGTVADRGRVPEAILSAWEEAGRPA